MPSINSFQLIGDILKAPDGCRQRELELFPLWLYLVEMYHADSQIIVGTIVQRFMGEVLGNDPVGIVFAGNSRGISIVFRIWTAKFTASSLTS